MANGARTRLKEEELPLLPPWHAPVACMDLVCMRVAARHSLLGLECGKPVGSGAAWDGVRERGLQLIAGGV